MHGLDRCEFGVREPRVARLPASKPVGYRADNGGEVKHSAAPAREERGGFHRLEARGMLQPMTRGFVIEFSNQGQAAAVFQVRALHLDRRPRSYTVEAGKRLTDSWGLASEGDYDLTVHGPNGFLRACKGRMHDDGRALLEAHSECRHEGEQALNVAVANFGQLPARLRMRDNYTGDTWRGALSPDDVIERRRSCARHHGWYDLVISSDEDAAFCWQFAGHIDNGRHSISAAAVERSALEA